MSTTLVNTLSSYTLQIIYCILPAFYVRYQPYAHNFSVCSTVTATLLDIMILTITVIF